jgi:hypothetical protein
MKMPYAQPSRHMAFRATDWIISFWLNYSAGLRSTVLSYARESMPSTNDPLKFGRGSHCFCWGHHKIPNNGYRGRHWLGHSRRHGAACAVQ